MEGSLGCKEKIYDFLSSVDSKSTLRGTLEHAVLGCGQGAEGE